MTGRPDDDLRAAFAELRHDRFAPSFAELTATDALDAVRRRHRRRRGVLLGTAAIMVVVVAVRARSDGEPDFARFTALTGIDLGQVTWTAPTDFLLETPGRRLLRSVPPIEVHVPLPSPDSIRSTDSNTTPRRRSDS